MDFEIKKRDFLAASVGLGAAMTASAVQAAQAAGAPPTLAPPSPPQPKPPIRAFPPASRQTSMVDRNFRPRRINKGIELWAQDQAVIYTSHAPSGYGDGYDVGRAMAKTWHDAINYEMEHGCFDFADLRNFMKGLVDGGPTASGHRTPMVFVTLPVTAEDEMAARTNQWVLQQTLHAGAHAIGICHASDPTALEYCVQAMRFPFDYPDTPKLPLQGLRGNGAQGFAAGIWGIHGNEYLHKADLWPLNPNGELVLGVKIENKKAHTNANAICATPGVCFAEWGGGDSTLSIVGLDAYPVPPPPPGQGGAASRNNDPRLTKARLDVLAACKAHGIRPLNISSSNDPLASYQEGSRVISSNDEAATLRLREATGRTMPI
jgi:4-hydroxy-2-oxoheptanedioate aldolase